MNVNQIFAGYKIQLTNDFWTKNVEILPWCSDSCKLVPNKKITLRQFKWENCSSKKKTEHELVILLNSS